MPPMPKYAIEKKDRQTGTWEGWGYVSGTAPRHAKDAFWEAVDGKTGPFRLLDPNGRVIDLKG